MGRTSVRRILVALDLSHQSGREHLAGFYRLADRKENWEIRLVPSTEESYLPVVRKFLAEGINGAVAKGECVPAMRDAIRAARVPTVVIDTPRGANAGKGNATFVLNDNANIGRAAARFFASLGNFASYAFVPDPSNCTWSRTRGKAFCDMLREKHPDAPVRRPSGTLREWLAALPKPAAVFAAFDACAATVLDACRELKIRVPDDVVVLGVDDDVLICEHTRPKLSSIRPDHAGQGFAAARELDRMLGSHVSRKGKTVICPHLCITERDSTRLVPPAVHLVREAKSYLAAHALEGIRVADVVRHLGVSARLANLRFAQAVGRSIRDELVRLRLNEAKRLLSHTSYPPKRIARDCGFASTIVLSHLFHAHFGTSMRDWRKCAVSGGKRPSGGRSRGT